MFDHRSHSAGFMTTLSLLSLLVSLACQLTDPNWGDLKASIRKEFPKVRQLSIEEFRKRPLDDIFLVDVREKEEYEVSHLKSGVNLTQAENIIKEFQKSGKQILVLYCSVGYRSSKMAQKIQQDIEKPVFSLEGSIFEWANQGLPVYKDSKQTDKVHPYNSFWGKLLKRSYWE